MPKKKNSDPTKLKKKAEVNLTIDILNLKGDSVGKTNLPKEIFGIEVSRQLLAQAVRVFQNNQRSGTHDTKTRGEVVGSTRKIYRQKGTGRARHGSITAPIFIGGGVAHGPHPKDYSLSLPKQMKNKALFGALSQKLQGGAIKIVRGLEKIEAKTKLMQDFLSNLKLDFIKKGKINTLLVTTQKADNIWRSGRNISYLKMEEARLLNAYTVLSHRNMILMEDAIPVLSDHFLGKRENLPKTEIKTVKKIKSRNKKV